jgi:CRISPR-associated endonuclease/helicase Cas3
MTTRKNNEEPLAHSPPAVGKSADPYARHVSAVRTGAVERANAMMQYAVNPPVGLLNAIATAATFHDLGKLDPEVQAVLQSGKGKLLWDHIDAGVAHLSAKQDWMAAWLVRAHHAPGLPQKHEHFTDGRKLRGRRHDDEPNERHDEQIVRTNSMLEKYVDIHESAVGKSEIERRRAIHGLSMRLALSCLVDADHSDTAFFDSGDQLPNPPEPCWNERLKALCEYVHSLPIGDTEEERNRNKHRNDFFQACLESDITDPLVACEAPVGLGKTTAVAAYLIRRARDEGLRRLIIVAPFTNILTQTAERLRKALVLPGEDADRVIVEHHHRADFSSRSDREFAVLWRAPIVLTTAVSFFETLAGADPASLRKLHSVPGSAVFLDEAHAALPTKLWPQNWLWVRELANVWGCRFVFASGSLVRFWENRDIIREPIRLPELLPPAQAVQVIVAEQHRVRYAKAGDGRVLNVSQLIDEVQKQQGPTLVILNTVQNAAIVADAMRRRCLDVLHLSTALTPYDRATILRRVERKLRFAGSPDWVLVATSCVEAGVDLSFRCAFRERFATASIIQVGGRVNRHGEYNVDGGGIVFDFALADSLITQHPAANVSAEVLRGLMDEGTLNDAMNPADVVTRAMVLELRNLGGLSSDQLVKAESEQNYPEVQRLGQVINENTRFVVVDPKVKELLRMHIPISFKMLLEGSVQIWGTKIDKLGLQPLHSPGRSLREIYEWNYDYDPDFLGYMQGLLSSARLESEGFEII